MCPGPLKPQNPNAKPGNVRLIKEEAAMFGTCLARKSWCPGLAVTILFGISFWRYFVTLEDVAHAIASDMRTAKTQGLMHFTNRRVSLVKA
ncbi:hypothetical protein WJX73_003032 [Symbiochloris irregularis]|uniref:Uncharacterized protein n=1 Tax=Symbiochloris irregularis TaxID=706552 RepID=A0AAW1PEB5_9CHLO